MSELYQLPDGWEWKKLNELTEVNIGKTPSRSKPEYFFGNNIWLSIRDLKGKYISDSNEKITEEAIRSSNIKVVKKGTLLMSFKLTLGKTSFAECDLYTNEAIASLPIKKEYLLDKYFLEYAIGVIDLEKEVDNAVKGKTLNKEKIKNLDIPLPPLEEQKRIVQKLDALFERIDKAIAILQKNIAAADNFMNSVLNDVFSDLEQNHPMELLFKIADVNRGKSKHRPRNDKRLFGGNYPFIQTGDVRNASKYITSYSDTYSEFGLFQSKLWQKGTICMTIAANIGDVAILGVDSCFPDSVVGIFSESESNEYLYYYLLTLKKQLESKATTTAQMNINIKLLQDIDLPLPSIDIQKRTVKYLDYISDQIEQVKSAQQQKMQNLLDLKSSILDQAFHGKL